MTAIMRQREVHRHVCKYASGQEKKPKCVIAIDCGRSRLRYRERRVPRPAIEGRDDGSRTVCKKGQRNTHSFPIYYTTQREHQARVHH